jgi:pantothenate kinase-related protein Tda10
MVGQRSQTVAELAAAFVARNIQQHRAHKGSTAAEGLEPLFVGIQGPQGSGAFEGFSPFLV